MLRLLEQYAFLLVIVPKENIAMKIVVYFPAYGFATGRMPHYRPVDQYAVPQSLLYLATAVERMGHDVLAIDGNVEGDPVEQIVGHDPRKVLISTTTCAFENALKVITELDRRGYDGEFFVGGSHPSLNLGLRDWLLPWKDRIQYIRSAGHNSIFSWVPEVFDGKKLDASFREFRPKVELIVDIYKPDRDWRFRHVCGEKALLCPSLVTAIGCTKGCTFCANSVMYDIEFMDETVVDDTLAAFVKMGVRGVAVQDMHFLMNLSHARGVMRLMNRHDLLYGVQTCVESLTAEILDELADSGCNGLLVGIENPASHTLRKEVQLDIVPWLLREAVGRRGIFMLYSYIVGLPGVSMGADLSLLRHIQEKLLTVGYPAHYLQCNLYTPYRPLAPGQFAPYEEEAVSVGKDVEYVLDRLPFHYWGVLPVALSDTTDFHRRMILCDLVAYHIYSTWFDRYLALRGHYAAILERFYPKLAMETPSLEESLAAMADSCDCSQ